MNDNEITSCKHNCPHKYKTNTEPPTRICTISNREIQDDDLVDIGLFGKEYTRMFPRYWPIKKKEG